MKIDLQFDTVEELGDFLRLFTDSRPEFFQALINKIESMEANLAQSLEALEIEVTENSDAIASAVTLIEGLSQQIKDAGVDPVKLAALTDKLDTNSKTLAAAVAANTPVAPEV